jgi:CubicO group peptidase (beta-lactamase class C family)
LTASQFDSARLSRAKDILRRHVERDVHDGGIPGLVALVSCRGEMHVEALGVRDLSSGAPVERDSVFRISSMTKPIVAAAALILVEECTLRLDDPVDRWLPELAGRRVLRRIDGPLDDTVSARRPISVRDLLTFRMGFGQLFARPDAYPILKAANERQIGMGPPGPAAMPAPDEWLRRLGELPLMAQPGERWLYNTGSDVLGVLIARCSGRPLPEFLRERLFEPLGMKDTAFSVPEPALQRFTTSYFNDFQTGELSVFDPIAGQWSHPPAFPSGAGGLISTIGDYYAFAQMLQDHGRHGKERILSRAAVELMTTDQLEPEQKALGGLLPGDFDHQGWGLGVSVVTHRRELFAPVGTYGWDGGLGSTWSNDPSTGVIALLLTNRMWTSPRRPPVALEFATAIYQALDS